MIGDRVDLTNPCFLHYTPIQHPNNKQQVEATDYPASLEMASFAQGGVKGQVAGAS